VTSVALEIQDESVGQTGSFFLIVHSWLAARVHVWPMFAGITFWFEVTLMFRVSLLAAVFGLVSISSCLAEGIGFSTSGSLMGTDGTSSFESVSSDRFASFKSSSPLSFDASPPSTLPLSIVPGGMNEVPGRLSSREAHQLVNPTGHVPSTASSVFASPGRYDSGASSRLSTLPSTSGSLMQHFQIPSASFGPSSGLPSLGSPSTLYTPTITPQVYFGTK
jgi:hypothetical protein